MINKTMLNRALKETTESHNRAINLSFERKMALSEKLPELAEIDAQLSEIGLSIAKVFFTSDPEFTVESLSRKSLALQKKRKEVLKNAGYAEDYLEPHFSCPICSDQGRADNKICECVKQRAVKSELSELAKTAPIDECTFDTFNFEFYRGITDENGNDVYEKTRNIYDYLKAYSEDFHSASKNIFMFGKTGLGKTHLALACAKKIIEKYYNVIYGTANNIFSALEEEKFRHISGKYSMNEILEADLLIIDDLGAEFSTSFTTAAVHGIIESRLLAKKPTIITTNLDIDSINKKYGERIASRIIGAYVPIKFEGKDIRQLKRFQY